MGAIRHARAVVARRAIAVAVAGLALGVSLAGTLSNLAAPEAAFRRVGTFVMPDEGSAAVAILFQAGLTLTLLAGAVVAMRVPGHPVGWLLLALGSIGAVAVASLGYVLLAYGGERVVLPAAKWAAWVTNGTQGAVLCCLGAVLFLFPTGRPVSRAWVRVFVVVGVVAIAGSVLFSLSPSPMPMTVGIPNPAALAPLGVMPFSVASVPTVALPVVGAVSMIVRYRGASDVERLQLRWLAAAASLAAVTVVVLWVSQGRPWQAASYLAFLAAFTMIPVAIGVAILRYRLYAIDVIIRRTLVYGGLTATLAVCYVGGVVVFQALLEPLTGGETISVAGATLLVAAAFRPVRDPLQDVIDRRFYRVRYDAARMASGLATRLGKEVDVEVIEDDLVEAVVEAVRPDRVGIWRSRSGSRASRA